MDTRRVHSILHFGGADHHHMGSRIHLKTPAYSLPTPENFDPSRGFLFLPTPSRLAFVLRNAALVWDTQCSTFLLNSDVMEPQDMTFLSRTQISTQDVTQLCHEIRDMKEGRINNILPDDLSKISNNIPAQWDTRDKGAPGYAENVYSTLCPTPPSDNPDSPAHRDSSPPLNPSPPPQRLPGPPVPCTPSPVIGTSVTTASATVAPGSGEWPADVENKERNSPSDSCLCPASSQE